MMNEQESEIAVNKASLENLERRFKNKELSETEEADRLVNLANEHIDKLAKEYPYVEFPEDHSCLVCSRVVSNPRSWRVVSVKGKYQYVCSTCSTILIDEPIDIRTFEDSLDIHIAHLSIDSYWLIDFLASRNITYRSLAAEMNIPYSTLRYRIENNNKFTIADYLSLIIALKKFGVLK